MPQHSLKPVMSTTALLISRYWSQSFIVAVVALHLLPLLHDARRLNGIALEAEQEVSLTSAVTFEAQEQRPQWRALNCRTMR